MTRVHRFTTRGDAVEREAEGMAARALSGTPAAASAASSFRDDLSASASASSELGLGSGRPLDTATRGFFEQGFGHDFSNVRVHPSGPAARGAESLGARAYTLGRDIVFAPGHYDPSSSAGRRVIGHELAHVVQRRAQAIPPTTIAADWIIDNPTHRATAGGRTDADLLADAFAEICSLFQLQGGNRIVRASGPPAATRTEGCTCLDDIEADLASPSPQLSATPHVKMEMHGWSYTDAHGSPPTVGVRHPENSFDWGYWTAGQTRHIKPFWQTLAHEICGHAAAFVRSRGGASGGRGVGTGHNVAIEGENRIAAEHGVTTTEQRGLDMSAGGTPLAGHRGESFLQATVADFAHASSSPPASATAIVTEVGSTVQTTATPSLAIDMLVQVEGHAFANEGGTALATQRAEQVRLAIATELRRRGISTTSARIGQGHSTPITAPRFSADLAQVDPGTSSAGPNPARRVLVYLFHQPHSAGP